MEFSDITKSNTEKMTQLTNEDLVLGAYQYHNHQLGDAIAILNESSKEPETEFLCRKSAAQLLGISLPTLGKLVKEQQIKPLYLGSLIRFDKKELEKCLQSRTIEKGRI